MPTFEIDPSGFRVRSPQGLPVVFEAGGKAWRPLQTDEFGQTVQLAGQGRGPLKLRTDLTSPGFGLYFQNGFGLKLACKEPPFVSWAEGSAGPRVPTPAADWILLSFQDPHPPLLLTFPDKSVSVTVTGSSGNWVLRSERLEPLWLRVYAPEGMAAKPTTSAGDLGRMVAKVKDAPHWFLSPPRFVRSEVAAEQTAVTATWTFDAPGAVVPFPLLQAGTGGYELKLESEVKRLTEGSAEGPLAMLAGRELRVRFPARRIPTGRGVGVGEPPDTIATASYLDVEGVAELALANLLPSRDGASREMAESILTEYLAAADYAVEPHTGQSLPFNPDGAGMELASAHALLMQAIENSRKSTSVGNSLLTSLAWRRDWATWRLWSPDQDGARRAAALASLAALLCPEPKRRLEAAMLQAGLAAERTLLAAAGRKPAEIEAPYQSLRRSLFGPNLTDEFAKLLLSEIRVYGDAGLWATSGEGGTHLVWRASDPPSAANYTMASAFPLALEPALNVEKVTVGQALGFSNVRAMPIVAGICSLRLQVPAWAPPLPTLCAPPPFRSPAP